MADINDAEIKIGVSLDSDKFLNEYNVLLNKVDAKTKDHIESAVSGASGTASKNWGEFPFAPMHDKQSGAQMAQKAFLGSLAQDLEVHGIGAGTLGYQSALLNASNIASTPDPWQRFHQMLASGLTQQADLTHPDTPLGRAIASDYELMKQPWSRDFITKSAKGQYVDFDRMREYAVDAGLGRWKNEELGNTADNFELISDELENIEENSTKSEKIFRGWGDTLKGVLGTLTAIGAVAGVAKAFEVAYTASEKGTIDAGTTLDKRRAFVGMSALDELAAQVASQSVGMSKDAITNEIINMSNNREKYKLLGEGLNALFPSLTGIFDNIMSSDNPMETYKGILKEVYDNMRGADQNTRSQTLMLLESQGLGSAAQIIGAMLSNDKLAGELGYDPTNLFTLRNNNYYGSFETAEAMLPDLAQLNASLEASYAKLYTLWEGAFGLPFKTWWNDIMQNTVIPWFEKILEFTGIGKSEAWKTVDQVTGEIAVAIGVPGMGGAIDERNKLIEQRSSRASYDNYKVPNKLDTGQKRWNTILAGDMSGKKGEVARGMWDKYLEVYEADTTGTDSKTKETQKRVKYMVDKLKETGLYSFLENRKNEDVDAYLLEALQMGVVGGDGGQRLFNQYIDKVLKIGIEGKKDDEILAALEKIAQNTEQKNEMLQKNDLWMLIEATYGTTVANSWKASLQRQ